MIHYNLNTKEDLKFAEIANIDLSKFINKGDNCYIDFEKMKEAKQFIIDSFKDEDALYDITDGTKYEGSKYETDLEMSIIKRTK